MTTAIRQLIERSLSIAESHATWRLNCQHNDARLAVAWEINYLKECNDWAQVYHDLRDALAHQDRLDDVLNAPMVECMEGMGSMICYADLHVGDH